MAVNLFISFLPEHQPEEFITTSRSSGRAEGRGAGRGSKRELSEIAAWEGGLFWGSREKRLRWEAWPG